jgi:copper(I)-binding protein
MLANGLEVPAKGEVLLKPGGYHVMLIGMTRDLQVGDTFSLDLQFEKSGTITVEPEVREP